MIHSFTCSEMVHYWHWVTYLRNTSSDDFDDWSECASNTVGRACFSILQAMTKSLLMLQLEHILVYDYSTSSALIDDSRDWLIHSLFFFISDIASNLIYRYQKHFRTPSNETRNQTITVNNALWTLKALLPKPFWMHRNPSLITATTHQKPSPWE